MKDDAKRSNLAVIAPPITPPGSIAASFPPGDALARFGELLIPAPPAVPDPDAWVTCDFRTNVKKCFVLIPSPGAPGGHFGLKGAESVASAPRLIRWAEANGHAACLFSAEALARDPGRAWKRLIPNSGAHSVYIVVAPGAFSSLAAALKTEHALTYTRIRLVVPSRVQDALDVVPRGKPVISEKTPLLDDGAGNGLLKNAKPESTDDLTDFFRRRVAWAMPPEWERPDPTDVKVQYDTLFRLFAEVEDAFQEREYQKMDALSNLKENDVPGMRRIAVEDRVQRVNRNRHEDELSRLLKAAEMEGVD